MSAPTVAVEWLLARAAMRTTGLLHIVSRRDSGALNPVCGANPIRSREIEMHDHLADVAQLCDGCAAMAVSIGGTVVDGVALLLGLTENAPAVRLLDVPLDSIRSDSPLRAADAGLVHSVAEHGVIQPLVVRRVGQHLQLVAGGRRLTAAGLAGLDIVPVIVRDYATSDDALISTLAENLHREDLDPIAQANAYAAALEQLQCPKEALADRLGVSRAQVSNTVRLLGLPEHLRKQIADGVLTAAHGRALLRTTDAHEQDVFADRIREDGVTARSAEAAARFAVTREPLDPQLARIAELLAVLLGTNVKVTRAGVVLDPVALVQLLARLEMQPSVNWLRRLDRVALSAGSRVVAMDLHAGDLLVARVWSWRLDTLKKDAAVSLAEQRAGGVIDPHLSVSTFAMACLPDEDAEALMRRLCDHIQGVPRRGKYVTFTTNRRLRDAGFPIELSEPPKHHYDVVLSNLDDDEGFRRLEAVFNEEPRRRFPSCQPT